MVAILEKVMETLATAGPNPMDILFSLILSFVVAAIISQIYKYTHRGLSFELNFMSTLVLLSPIVTVVMLFIRGDLVLSLGLIGSLSIIRFRTPIKDTRDMVFLFWVITVGLGCGTYNWTVVVLSSFLISLVMIFLHLIKYGQSHHVDYVLVVGGDSTVETEAVVQTIRQYTKEFRLRSNELNGSSWEGIFEIRLTKTDHRSANMLVGEIKKNPGITKVSLLAPQIALPV